MQADRVLAVEYFDKEENSVCSITLLSLDCLLMIEIRLARWFLISVTHHRRSMGWLASLWERTYPTIVPRENKCLLCYGIRIVQSLSTLVLGVILGLIFIWKVGLVGLGTLSSSVSNIIA